MKSKFTLTERIILEVLSQDKTDFEELLELTNLKKEVLLNSLHLLMIKKVIICDEWSYQIDQNYVKKHRASLISYKENMVELQTLVNSAIEYSVEKDDHSFKIKKVALNNRDLILVKGLLGNIEAIINQSSQEKTKVKDKTVFYWGHGNYQQIINQALC